MPSWELPPAPIPENSEQPGGADQKEAQDISAPERKQEFPGKFESEEEILRAIDEEWFEAVIEAERILPPMLATLDGPPANNKEERALIEAGSIRNPVFTYENIDPKTYERAEDSFLFLRAMIEKEMENGDRRTQVGGRLYVAKINEKIARMRLMRAAVNGDYELFQQYADRSYGKPSPEVFIYLTDDLRSKAEYALVNSDDPEIRYAAQELHMALEQFPRNEFNTFGTSKNAKAIKELVRKDLTDILRLPIEYDPNKEYKSQEVIEIFSGIMARLDPTWEVIEVDDNKATVSVDSERKKIRVSKNLAIYGKRLQELTTHEIGTHAVRSVNGYKTDLKLLAIGLEKNEEPEEGLAIIKEGAIYQDEKTPDEGRRKQVVSEFGGHGYIATALAEGFAVEQESQTKPGTMEKVWAMEPRDFREVYDFSLKMLRFMELTSGKNPKDKIPQKVLDRTWTTCRRVFRGLNGQTKGYAFPKEMAYTEGPLKTWLVIDDAADIVETYRLLHLGKYNLGDPEHVRALEELGIIVQKQTLPSDEDLVAIEPGAKK